MAVHELKISPDLYLEVFHGFKTAEIRLNDRDYKVGDVLDLYPYDSVKKKRAGYSHCRRTVTHILQGGQYGIEQGYVLLSMGSAKIPL